MNKKRLIKIILASIIFVTLLANNAYAASPKSTLHQCLKKIKKKEYSESYLFFSSSLKRHVSLERHIETLQKVEGLYGGLKNYSSRHPLFKNYFLDEDMFKGMFSGNKQTAFRYFLHFEQGMLILFAELEKENDEYKIKVFYLEEIEHDHQEMSRKE